MRLSLLICLTLLSAACDNDSNNTCSVNDPVTELDWLKEIIETYQGGTTDLTVEQATYRFKTIFIATPCCSMCDATYGIVIPPVYNCKGEELEGLSADSEEIWNKKVIWQTPVEEADCW